MELLEYNLHVFSLICLYQMRLYYLITFLYSSYFIITTHFPTYRNYKPILRVSPGPLESSRISSSKAGPLATILLFQLLWQKLTASPIVTTGSNPF